MADWYLEQGSEVSGPYSWDELRFLSDRSKIGPGHRVRQGADGGWSPVENVPGLQSASNGPMLAACQGATVAQPAKPANAAKPTVAPISETNGRAEPERAPPPLPTVSENARQRRIVAASVIAAGLVVGMLLVLLVGLMLDRETDSAAIGTGAGTGGASIGDPSQASPGEQTAGSSDASGGRPAVNESGTTQLPPQISLGDATATANVGKLDENDPRDRWLNESYNTTVRHVKGKVWEHVGNKTGQVLWAGNETARTSEYIELLSERNEELRVRAQRMELHKDGKWEWAANGHWETAPNAGDKSQSPSEPRGRNGAKEDSRVQWINETYNITVRYVSGKKEWEEVDNQTGHVNWVDREAARTADHVELFSPERKSEIRLRADRMEQKLQGKWGWVANGHWVVTPTDGAKKDSAAPDREPQGDGQGDGRTMPPPRPPLPQSAAVIMPLEDESPSGDTADSSPGAAGGKAEFFEIQGKGRKFTYVVDCSGSMAGAPFTKARRELLRSVEALKSGQSFFVIFFDDGAYPQFYPHDSDGMLRATAVNKARARQWINAFMAPGGGTDPRVALIRALALQPDAIYLLSDGEFDATIADQVRMQNHKRVAIHTISFITREAEFLLQQIARENNGSYRFVP